MWISWISRQDLENRCRIVDYTDDERLALLVDSLMRLAATMRSSREAISELGTDFLSAPVVFDEPDGSDRVDIVLS